VNSYDVFGYFWLSGVAFMGLFQLAWAINDWRSGIARLGFVGGRYERSEEPFNFWMTMIMHFAGVILACFMFWFGLDMSR
jgi:hypothetical protein